MRVFVLQPLCVLPQQGLEAVEHRHLGKGPGCHRLTPGFYVLALWYVSWYLQRLEHLGLTSFIAIVLAYSL